MSKVVCHRLQLKKHKRHSSISTWCTNKRPLKLCLAQWCKIEKRKGKKEKKLKKQLSYTDLLIYTEAWWYLHNINSTLKDRPFLIHIQSVWREKVNPEHWLLYSLLQGVYKIKMSQSQSHLKQLYSLLACSQHYFNKIYNVYSIAFANTSFEIQKWTIPQYVLCFMFSKQRYLNVSLANPALTSDTSGESIKSESPVITGFFSSSFS